MQPFSLARVGDRSTNLLEINYLVNNKPDYCEVIYDTLRVSRCEILEPVSTHHGAIQIINRATRCHSPFVTFWGTHVWSRHGYPSRFEPPLSISSTIGGLSSTTFAQPSGNIESKDSALTFIVTTVGSERKVQQVYNRAESGNPVD